MTVHQKLSALRSIMLFKNIDAVIIPSSDPHQSEYVAAHWQERVYISGFTGSAGTVVVTKDHAGLWTDSRYYLQAAIEFKDTEFVLHKMINQFAVPYVDFLIENLHSDATVAVNGFMFSKSSIDVINQSFNLNNIHLNQRLDLISEIWKERPDLSDAPIEFHDEKYSGKSIGQKLSEIRTEMFKLHVDYHLITTLDDLAWTFNVRGKDVEYNPVSIGYAIVGMDESYFFVDSTKLTQRVISELSKNNILAQPYDSIISFLNKMAEDSSILVDPNLCSQSIFEAINCKVVSGTSIPKTLKAIKNETEIGHIRDVMKKDGAALANAFYWLEQSLIEKKPINEVDVAEKIAQSRSLQTGYQGESFGAIIGYNENGAIIHYHPESTSCKTIESTGILLADSGGQYLDGTTDITRTFALGKPTPDQKKSYTLILKGMIALSKAKFPEGTSGAQLDTFARQFLWSEGLNYGHGTGHGVGFYLNVHEPPQGFAPVHSERGKTVHVPGMLTSNEPGYYKEGEYGMRIENLIICQKSNTEGFLEFETVTLYPFEHALIDKTLLTQDELTWINSYHKLVYSGVSPLLNEALKTWFQEKCREI